MSLRMASRKLLEGERAVGALRISTARQRGLPAQRAAVEEFCAANGMTLVAMFEDKAKGDKFDRDGLIGAVRMIAYGEAEVLVLPTIKRWGRHKEGIMKTLERVGVFERARIVIADTGMEFMPKSRIDSTGYMTQELLAAMAEWDRAQLIGRLNAQKDAARAAGKRVDGSPPYGWVSVRGVLYEDEQEQQWLAVMRAMRADGLSYAKIAESLNEVRARPKLGERWHPGSVQRILDPLARQRDAARKRKYAKERMKTAEVEARRQVLRYLSLPEHVA